MKRRWVTPACVLHADSHRFIDELVEMIYRYLFIIPTPGDKRENINNSSPKGRY